MKQTEIPEAAWTRRLDEKLGAGAPNTSSRPPVLEILQLLPVAYRVASYLLTEKKAEREPIFDLRFTLGGLEPPQTGSYSGVPIGGLGSGAIGRGYRGDFRRWSLHPGKYMNNIVHGDVFSIRVKREGGEVHSQVLSVFDGDHAGSMKGWKWNLPPASATYHGLFPRAWTVYVNPVPGITLTLRQISPVIPNSYSESSLPTGVFIAEVENTGEGSAEVSIMFSFVNSVGEEEEEGVNEKDKFHASFKISSGEEGRSETVEGVCMSRIKTTKKKFVDQNSLAIATTTSSLYPVPSSSSSSDPSDSNSPSPSPPSIPNEEGFVSICHKFRISKSGSKRKDTTAQRLWDQFTTSGDISSFAEEDGSDQRAEVAGAVCLRKTVLPGEKRSYPFSVSWDTPIARFGEGRGHYRYYTNFFGGSGLIAPSIAAYALLNVTSWENRIYEWQRHVLEDSSLSNSYKCLLFNELYFIVDGGGIWAIMNQDDKDSLIASRAPADDNPLRVSTDKITTESEESLPSISGNNNDGSERTVPSASSTLSEGVKAIPEKMGEALPSGLNKEELEREMFLRAELRVTADMMRAHDELITASEGSQLECGRFLYLEGHEYAMYNTYDVHFYASYALLHNWPMIELSMQRDYAAAVYDEDLTRRKMLGHGPPAIRKIKGSVPHDLGSPSEDPWTKVNIYNFQDVCNWKDLGSKFVLQVYRNYVHTKTLAFCRDLYPVVLDIMEYTERFDRDGDGMIENSGFPDQTYDIWVAKGVHAYCGGLWICACFATAAMATLFKDEKNAEKYASMGVRARKVYNDTLWNGTYLDFDSSTSPHHDSIMADMLAGQWYAHECNLPRIVIATRAYSCYKTIFEHNVVHFGKGKLLGAVNGYRPSKRVDDSCIQSREVWPGTTYGLAAAMILESGVTLEFQQKSEEAISLKLPSDLYETDDLTHDQRNDLFHMAMKTAEGIYNAGWVEFGYWYTTPEAWERDGAYRSKGYMRPLSVWAMQSAIEKFQK